MEEKFSLPTKIIDAKYYRQAQAAGSLNPFDDNAIVITSIHFASRHADEVKAVGWNLVVIDEAHKLRNAYRQSNKMGQNIRWALEDCRKILLTATPLQNSLLELYGLSTILDEHIFGDLPSFRTQYLNAGSNLNELRERLRAICIRTLRRQVVEYIQFTERRAITMPFQPTEQEHKLYEAISGFLQRENTYALPYQQRHLTTLIVRKLLASSSQAVAATLEVMRDRLIALRDDLPPPSSLAERIIEDEEIEEEILDEILDGNGEQEATHEQPAETMPPVDRKKLKAEIEELDTYIRWARSIGVDTKIVFTESRRTQEYLKDFLESNGYAGRVVTFNGTNRDPESTQIYQRWIETNAEAGRVSGSRPVDVRTAIIEHFRDHASIMVATEAAAEGINLQFCSLVVNFDLPWNPQRIEQRIGRCHRYGQKHDVVVINFLNERNEADRRVYELLCDKFRLFSGLFGASDEVLGALESGVDFERRVLDIYQECRTSEEIAEAFRKLQEELDEKIKTKLADTRRMLLEHFDEDVHARLRVNLEGTRQRLDRMGRMFWELTKVILDGHALFDDPALAFDLTDPPITVVRPGRYHMISKVGQNVPGEFLYRLSHPLGEHVVRSGKAQPTPAAQVVVEITAHPAKISVVEALRGRAGWLFLQRLVIDSFDREEYLLFSGFDDAGQALDQETCERLFHCQGRVVESTSVPDGVQDRLAQEGERHVRAMISRSLEANSRFFNEERERLDKWAEDMVLAAEKELKDTKAQIKALNRQARQAATTQEQHELQQRIRDLERKKRRQRQRIFDVEDEIMEKRDCLIDALEKRLAQKTNVEPLFTIQWRVT